MLMALSKGSKAARQQGVGLAAGGSSKISVSCGQSSNGRPATDKAARVGQLQAGQQGSIVIAVRCQRRVVRAAVYCRQRGRVLGSKALPSPVLGRFY